MHFKKANWISDQTFKLLFIFGQRSEMTKNNFTSPLPPKVNAIIEFSVYHHSILLVLTLDELHGWQHDVTQTLLDCAFPVTRHKLQVVPSPNKPPPMSFGFSFKESIFIVEAHLSISPVKPYNRVPITTTPCAALKRKDKKQRLCPQPPPQSKLYQLLLPIQSVQDITTSADSWDNSRL